jgi:hypothetical protein
MNTLRRLSTAFIWMGLQLLLFAAAYTIAYESVRFYRGSLKRDLGYGIMLHYGLYLFGALAAASGVIQTSALSLRAKIIGAAVCAGVFFIYLWPSFPITPYRGSLLLVVGIACLSVPLIVSRRASAVARPDIKFEAQH